VEQPDQPKDKGDGNSNDQEKDEDRDQHRCPFISIVPTKADSRRDPGFRAPELVGQMKAYLEAHEQATDGQGDIHNPHRNLEGGGIRASPEDVGRHIRPGVNREGQKNEDGNPPHHRQDEAQRRRYPLDHEIQSDQLPSPQGRARGHENQPDKGKARAFLRPGQRVIKEVPHEDLQGHDYRDDDHRDDDDPLHQAVYLIVHIL
jgi:hypothetical protein